MHVDCRALVRAPTWSRRTSMVTCTQEEGPPKRAQGPAMAAIASTNSCRRQSDLSSDQHLHQHAVTTRGIKPERLCHTRTKRRGDSQPPPNHPHSAPTCRNSSLSRHASRNMWLVKIRHRAALPCAPIPEAKTREYRGGRPPKGETTVQRSAVNFWARRRCTANLRRSGETNLVRHTTNPTHCGASQEAQCYSNRMGKHAPKDTMPTVQASSQRPLLAPCCFACQCIRI